MNNSWQKRAVTKFVCQSGNEVMARRSSPSLSLKANRYQRVLKKIEDKDVNQVIEKMQLLPDDELESLTDFAAITIEDSVVEPALSLKPKQGEFSPHDIPPADFWEIFMWISKGCPSIPVETKEGETTVEAVSNFPGGQVDPDVGAGSEQVQ